MNKITYELKYIPASAKKLNQFMVDSDLGIKAIVLTEEYVITTRTNIDKEYIEGLKEVLEQALKNTGAEVHSVTYLHHTI